MVPNMTQLLLKQHSSFNSVATINAHLYLLSMHLSDVADYNCNNPPISGSESIRSMVYRYITISYLLPPLLTTNRYTAI